MTPSDDVEAADWIPGRLNGFAENVGSVVPTGFEAYARIFHPATTGAQHPGIDVRWSEVAAAAGRIVHPEMQFHAIATPVPNRPAEPAQWDGLPKDGTLSARQLRALVEILPAHTTTPNTCWMCLWEGYGYNTAVWLTAVASPPRRPGQMAWFRRLSIGSRKKNRGLPGRPDQNPSPHVDPEFRDRMSGPPRFAELCEIAKRVSLPGRDYLLFKGTVTQAEGWGDGPNLWWPEDRMWCVASEIDFPYTYVGGSRELIEEILCHPALEALPATLDQGINYASDGVNS